MSHSEIRDTMHVYFLYYTLIFAYGFWGVTLSVEKLADMLIKPISLIEFNGGLDLIGLEDNWIVPFKFGGENDQGALFSLV